MANFDRTWPDTAVDGMTVHYDELKDIDRKLCKTINAKEGSAHALEGPVSVGGPGTWNFACVVHHTAPLTGTDANFTDSLSYGLLSGGDIFCGSIQSGGDVSASGQVACDSLFCANGLTAGAIQTPTGGAISCGGDLSVNGTSTLKAVTATSLQVTGGAAINTANMGDGTLTVTPTQALLTEPMKCNTRGRTVPRHRKITVDGDQNISIEDGPEIRVLSGALTAQRTYNLNHTGAVEGDIITIVNESTAYIVTVYDGPSITSVGQLRTAPGNAFSLTAWFSDGQWRLRTTSRIPSALQ